MLVVLGFPLFSVSTRMIHFVRVWRLQVESTTPPPCGIAVLVLVCMYSSTGITTWKRTLRGGRVDSDAADTARASLGTHTHCSCPNHDQDPRVFGYRITVCKQLIYLQIPLSHLWNSDIHNISKKKNNLILIRIKKNDPVFFLFSESLKSFFCNFEKISPTLTVLIEGK